MKFNELIGLSGVQTINATENGGEDVVEVPTMVLEQGEGDDIILNFILTKTTDLGLQIHFRTQNDLLNFARALTYAAGDVPQGVPTGD